MRYGITVGLATLLIVAGTAQTAVSPETLRNMLGLSILRRAFQWHRTVAEYDAEFRLLAYDPLLQDYRREIFALWLNRELSLLSQLAIRAETYGQSYTASPAFAQWWDGNESHSLELPANPLDPQAVWIGPFGDTAAGAATLDANYRISDLWSHDSVQNIQVAQGVHTFQIRNRSNEIETLTFPYWEVKIRTRHYEVVVRVGKETPILLYYSKSKEGRMFWEETWYPLRWR